MVAQIRVILQLDEVINEAGKAGGLPGACGNTFGQLIEKYGTTVGADTGSGCTNCVQHFVCPIFDWKKASQLVKLKSGVEENHF